MPTIYVCDFFVIYDANVTRTGSDEKCRCALDCRKKKENFKTRIQNYLKMD